MLQTVLNLIKSALSWVLQLLPDSPFQMLSVSPIQPYLAAINWIIPMNFILATTQAWLVAIAAYYIYSAILRWVKAVS